jgi:hypothetical protein
MVLILAYSLASPLLHHLWFALQGEQALLQGFFVMFIGDLMGSLIVVYAVKAALHLMPTPSASVR